MEETRYDWDTWYETANNIMCHKFSNRVEIRTSLETGMIRLYKDGNEVNTIDGKDMTLKEYTRILLRTANEERQLQVINS